MSQVEWDPNCASLETAFCQTETTKDKSKRMDILRGRPKKKKKGKNGKWGGGESAIPCRLPLSPVPLFPFLPHPTRFDTCYAGRLADDKINVPHLIT